MMNNLNHKKALVISYYFPPFSTVAVHRIIRLAKFLPNYNWTPVFLTVNKNKSLPVDMALLSRLPDHILYYKTNSIKIFKYENAIPFHASTGKKNNLYGICKYLIRQLIRKMYHLYLYIINFFIFPDDAMGWLPFAVIKGKRIIKQNDIDIIFATGGPFTNFIIGYFLKILTKKPLIIEYRDPWTQIYYMEEQHKSRLAVLIHRKLAIWIEKKILRRSDHIIFVTNSFRDYYIHAFDQNIQKKTTVITNGFDDEQTVAAIQKKPSDKLTFMHSGTFYGTRTPIHFLTALDELIFEGLIDTEQIEVILTGKIVDTQINHQINRLTCRNVISVKGVLNQKDNMECLIRSDVLLLITGNHLLDEIGIPAKLFEYLLVKKYILGLTSINSESSKIITEAQYGTVVNFDDKPKIRNILLNLYDTYKKHGYIPITPDHEYIKQYEARHLISKTANIFNQIQFVSRI